MPLKEAAEIVAAYLTRNPVAASEIPNLIQQVGMTLYGLNARLPAVAPRPDPAVPIRRSVQSDHIVCLECGKKHKMLKRHIATAHELTEQDYRARWSLPRDYPMTAPGYAERRSQIAKQLGLGRRGR